jgi:hypothetical protein
VIVVIAVFFAIFFVIRTFFTSLGNGAAIAVLAFFFAKLFVIRTLANAAVVVFIIIPEFALADIIGALAVPAIIIVYLIVFQFDFFMAPNAYVYNITLL